LDRRDSRALLEAVLPAPLDERVLERIVVETRGNPLALLEMPRELTAAQLAGGFGLVGDSALVGHAAASLGIEEPAAYTLESENILAFTPRVAFRHPLVRSAVHRAAAPEERPTTFSSDRKPP
jgi:hypothetical protein